MNKRTWQGTVIRECEHCPHNRTEEGFEGRPYTRCDLFSQLPRGCPKSDVVAQAEITGEIAFKAGIKEVVTFVSDYYTMFHREFDTKYGLTKEQTGLNLVGLLRAMFGQAQREERQMIELPHCKSLDFSRILEEGRPVTCMKGLDVSSACMKPNTCPHYQHQMGMTLEFERKADPIINLIQALVEQIKKEALSGPAIADMIHQAEQRGMQKVIDWVIIHRTNVSFANIPLSGAKLLRDDEWEAQCRKWGVKNV